MKTEIEIKKMIKRLEQANKEPIPAPYNKLLIHTNNQVIHYLKWILDEQ